jgi:hypothetical protein
MQILKNGGNQLFRYKLKSFGDQKGIRAYNSKEIANYRLKVLLFVFLNFFGSFKIR